VATFDLAIVGAGSAGCALAGRLAARTRLRIAVIEAGLDFGPRPSGRWPSALLDAHHTPDRGDYDWGYAQSRARVIGGCSTHNECGLVRPQPGDFDAWNVPGWTDRDLAPVIAEVERRLPRWRCPEDELGAWQRAFLDAALAQGFPRLPDDDVATAIGVGPVTQNIVDGVRWNASFVFLDEVRPRVTILAGLLSDRLVLEGDRARGLIVLDGTGEREIRAERFMLSAGVYGSPSILLRSGVGPPPHLRDFGIPVRVPLPGVGANLHDHPGVGLDYVATPGA
jgi:choline dehydrogenase-like flavoprotein